MRSSQKDSSFLLASQALKKSELVGYEKGVSRAQLNLGMYFVNTHSLEKASMILLGCQRDFENQNDKFHLAITKWYLAKVYLRSGDSRKSEKFYSESSSLFSELGDEKMYIFAQNGLGYLLLRQDRFSEALTIYEDILKMGQGLDLPQGGQNHTYNNIADILVHLGSYTEALNYVQQAIREAAKNNFLASESFKIASEIHSAMGNLDSAIYYINKCQEAALKRQQYDMVSLAYLIMADYSESKGDVSASLENVRKSVEILKSSESVERTYEAYFRLAQLHESLNDMDSAVYYLKKTERIAKNGEIQIFLRKVYEKLSLIYKERSEIDSAFKYLKLTEILNQKVFDEKMAKQFAKFNVEIATLEAEKKLQEAQNERVVAIKERTQIIALSGVSLLFLSLLFAVYRQRLLKNQLKLEKEKKSLRDELEQNQQLLSAQTLTMIHKNNGFSEIAENLKEANGSGNKIKKIIDINMALEKDWKNFNEYFSHVHGDFYAKLKERHPGLSITETRLCSMVKMGLKNKEMATILNIEYSSITMAKYRLKKKMELEEEEDVNAYVNGL